MIKSITVTNHLGDMLTMELTRPELSGLIVESVTGLGPPKATINTTEIATLDGASYNGARANSRNIVLSVIMYGTSAEDSRHLTYKYFPVKKRVRLDITTDIRTCYTYGYVESNEPNIFSAQESAQISILCPDPFFYSSDGAESIVFSGIAPMFEFPFENDSLTENLLIMSEILRIRSKTIFYNGDVDIGMLITIHATDNVKNITIYNITTQEKIVVDTDVIKTLTGTEYGKGDDIIISTVTGQKYARLLRGGVYTNIINAIDKSSDWPIVYKGENTFAYMAESGVDDIELSLTFVPTYEGV